MKNRLIMTAVFAVAAAVSSQAALIAHYTFDTDGTATAGADSVLGASASINNTDFVVGGGALSLSGSPAVDTAGNDGAVGGETFTWATDTRTVAFFVKAASGDKGDNNATMISLGSGTGGGNRFDIRLNGDNLRLEVQSGGANTTVAVADGTWHHLAIVVPVDGAIVNNVLWYFDGGTLGGGSQGTFSGSTTGIATGDGPLRMGDGYQDLGRDFKGSLDDVHLYDSALSAGEIASLAAIPEPATLGMVAVFGGAILFIRRNKMML